MKKKISVISLILLFFVSTTGLPLTINICSLMDTPQADICEMHSEHKTCEYEANKVSVKTEITKTDCCKTELIDKSICDKYLQASSQNSNLNHPSIVIINDNFLVNNNLLINPLRYFNDTSPPSLLNNHIYLKISILLI
jgi:hypothetical protein